jgi:hypothetical protein
MTHANPITSKPSRAQHGKQRHKCGKLSPQHFTQGVRFDMKTLKIYQTTSGLWSGKILNAQDNEIIRIAGLASPEEVQSALQAQGFEVQAVEVDA